MNLIHAGAMTKQAGSHAVKAMKIQVRVICPDRKLLLMYKMDRPLVGKQRKRSDAHQLKMTAYLALELISGKKPRVIYILWQFGQISVIRVA